MAAVRYYSDIFLIPSQHQLSQSCLLGFGDWSDSSKLQTDNYSQCKDVRNVPFNSAACAVDILKAEQL